MFTQQVVCKKIGEVMNKDNIAVGLDIGTTKIVAMIGRKMNTVSLKF